MSAAAFALTPEELLDLFVARCIGHELPEAGVLRVEDLSDAQAHSACQVLDRVQAHFKTRVLQ